MIYFIKKFKEFNRVIINQLYQYGIYNNITEFIQSSIPFKYIDKENNNKKKEDINHNNILIKVI